MGGGSTFQTLDCYVKYLYGTVWSSEESLIGGCGHREGPLDKSLCDAPLAPSMSTVLRLLWVT